MKLRFFISIILSIFFNILVNAQSGSYKEELNLSFGTGNSLYSNISTQQFIVFYKLNDLSAAFGSFSLDSDVNLEFISQNQSTTVVAGLAPIFKYEADLLGLTAFIKAGVGFNYINNHNIGSRNIGGHFIFSDMISIGSRIINTQDYSVEISYMLRHISNAGIFDSNEGFNSQYLVLSLNM